MRRPETQAKSQSDWLMHRQIDQHDRARARESRAIMRD